MKTCIKSLRFAYSGQGLQDAKGDQKRLEEICLCFVKLNKRFKSS